MLRLPPLCCELKEDALAWRRPSSGDVRGGEELPGVSRHIQISIIHTGLHCCKTIGKCGVTRPGVRVPSSAPEHAAYGAWPDSDSTVAPGQRWRETFPHHHLVYGRARKIEDWAGAQSVTPG